MGKNQSASNLTNIIKQDANGNISFVSGSTTLMSVSSSGAIATTGNVAGTASYASNADLLDGLDSTVFTLTSSFAAQTASFTAFTSSVNTFTASLNSFSASILTFTASQNILNGTYATTGSNTFTGIQTVNSNLIVTGSITAQTLVVQTITSSVDFVTGSTRFGSILDNTHVFSGSVTINPGGLFVSSSGNVGIGLTNSKYLLQLSGSTSLSKMSIQSSGSSYGQIQITNNITGGEASMVFVGGNGVLSEVPTSTDGDAAIFGIGSNLYGAGTTKFGIGNKAYGTNILTVSASGNVGIGTVNPTARLEVYGGESGMGQFTLAGTYGGIMRFAGSGVNKWAISVESGLASDKFGIFSYAANAYVAVITTSGNVGIGTTSPSYKLEVSGSIRAGSGNSTALLVAATGTASTQAAIAIQQLTTEGDTIIFADYEPYATYGIVAKNDIDCIDFNAGNSTNSLTNYNIINRTGTTVPAYVKTRIGLTSGNMFVGGNIGIGTINPGVSLDLGSKTDALRLTNGTTAQRPTAAAGQIRYNTSLGEVEVNNGSNWGSLQTKVMLGSSPSNPAESANDIKTYYPNATNGFYWIRQTGSTAVSAYCVFKDFTGADIAGGPWTVPIISNDANSNFSTVGPTALATFLSKCSAIGINTPGRGMESSRTTTEVYGAWLAVKRTIWEAYTPFISNGNTSGGAVLRMPMININGEGGTSDHRLVYNTSLGTHLPPNESGDACNAAQLFCGWWAANDITSWRTNDNNIPGPEDWGPSDTVNTSYNGAGVNSVLTICVYK